MNEGQFHRLARFAHRRAIRSARASGNEWLARRISRAKVRPSRPLLELRGFCAMWPRQPVILIPPSTRARPREQVLCVICHEFWHALDVQAHIRLTLAAASLVALVGSGLILGEQAATTNALLGLLCIAFSFLLHGSEQRADRNAKTMIDPQLYLRVMTAVRKER